MIFTSKHIPEQSVPLSQFSCSVVSDSLQVRLILLCRKSLIAEFKTDHWLLFTSEGPIVLCDLRSSSPSPWLSSWAQLPLSDLPFPNAGAQQAFLGQQKKTIAAFQENSIFCVFKGLNKNKESVIQRTSSHFLPAQACSNCLLSPCCQRGENPPSTSAAAYQQPLEHCRPEECLHCLNSLPRDFNRVFLSVPQAHANGHVFILSIPFYAFCHHSFFFNSLINI